LLLFGFVAGVQARAPGEVLSSQKISDTEGNFSGTLANHDWLGWSVAAMGDIDGDGVGDLVVGAPGDDGMGDDCPPVIPPCPRGAVWLLFLEPDGSVAWHQKIGDQRGGFTGVLEDRDFFGTAVAALGDLDGDGVGDLAVGAYSDSDNGTARGAVWVLHLESDGIVKSHQKINETHGGFTGMLENGDFFGAALAALGDLDDDGVGDLAVGAWGDNEGGINRGAVWVLFLNGDGTVKSHQKINDLHGGLRGATATAGSAAAPSGCSFSNVTARSGHSRRSAIPRGASVADSLTTIVSDGQRQRWVI
jgi:hypothetical protein